MYKALISFSGKISMAAGEVREITDSAIVKDLLKAKYIEQVKENDKKATAKPETNPKTKATAKPAKAAVKS